jgi:signal transduction histidine kinase
MRRCLLALVLCLVAPPAEGAGHDHVVELAHIADMDRTHGLDDVRRLSPRPFDGGIALGYSAGAHWIRVVVRPADDGAPLKLRIRPQDLDRIELFDPDAGSEAVAIRGDQHPPPADFHRALHHFFVVQPRQPSSEYWLRVESTSALTLIIDALRQKDFHDRSQTTEYLYLVHVGILVCFTVWGAILLAAQRDALTLSFVVSQPAAIALALCWSGFLRLVAGDVMPPDMLDWLGSTAVLLATCTTLVFHALLLRSLGATRLAAGLVMGAGAVSFLALLMHVAGATRDALALNMNMAFFGPPMMLAAAIHTAVRLRGCWPAGNPPAPVMLGFYAIHAALLVPLSLAHLGAAPATIVTLHGAAIHGLLNGVAMMALLQLRAQRMQRGRLRLAYRQKRLRHAIARQRAALEERGQLVTMLAHEIKSPLSVLRMCLGARERSAVARERAERAIADIDLVVERCTRALDFDGGGAPPQLADCDAVSEILGIPAARQDAERILLKAESVPHLRTDRCMFRTIVSNLLDNALKYGRPDRPVLVEVRPCHRKDRMGLSVTVTNEVGRCGTPDEARLFTKFYRAPGAHSTAGAGIGLYLSNSFSRLLGGELAYRSSPRQVSFTLWIPCSA